jgi:hypothetical protein
MCCFLNCHISFYFIVRVANKPEQNLKRRIIKLYEQAAEDMASKAAASNSGSLTERFALDLTRDLRGRVRQLWEEVGDSTRAGMLRQAQRASAVQTSFLDEAGQLLEPGLHLKLQAAFGKVPEEAVAHVLRGGIYGGEAPMLSKRIWNNAALQSGKIEEIIAQAVAKGESPIKLARALEAYVRPDAMEPDAWNDIYDIPFDYKIDYNAKRLAVTSMRHAAWGATISAGMKNPFADFLHWELTPAHVIFDVCDGYAEHEEGLGPGNWPLESAPLPHPWCTCLYYMDTNKSLDEIARELNTWARGERGDARLDAMFGEWEREGGIGSPQTDRIETPENSRRVGTIIQKVSELIKPINPDVYLLKERLEHIEKEHPKDLEAILSKLSDCIEKPALVLQEVVDESVLHFLSVYDDRTFIDAVVKVSKEPELVNSIITGIRIRKRGVKSLGNKFKTLYTESGI